MKTNDRLNDIISLFLNNNFKITLHKDKTYTLKSNPINIYVGTENIIISIWGDSKSYSYWHCNQLPSEKEITNLLFFNNLIYKDKIYLYNKISKYNLGRILDIDLVFSKLKQNYFLMKKNEINAIEKRLVLYETFTNN